MERLLAGRSQRGIGGGGETSAWDIVGLGARNTRQGESIAQRSRRSQREIGGGGETSACDIVGLGARNMRQGESIAQRSRRSQREIGVGGETSAWDIVGLGARIMRRGESIAQRSQRGIGLVVKLLPRRRWLGCEKHGLRGSIAQRSRRSQREIGCGGETSAWDIVGLGARNTRQGESIAQRSQRSQRGIGLVVKLLPRRRWPGCEKHAPRGKHRTEVTEGDREWW